MGAPANQTLFTDMDRAKDLVDAKTAEIDKKLVQPATSAYKQALSDYPFGTIFLTVLVILSFFPVAAFVGFTLCVGSVIVASALLIAAFWFTVIVGGAALVLCAALSLAVCLSLVTTFCLALGVAGKRLIFHVKEAGALKEGAKNWFAEFRVYASQTAQLWSGKQSTTDEITFGRYSSYSTLDGTPSSTAQTNGYSVKEEANVL